ncbi:hypothetical protein [Streptomyces sp. ICC1]|uniref:hypothetical protein n=1 Tax=Streptomyces sp. ICC1 TaxID=2099583 RepID=UPI0013A6A4B9|nr:hypothetical protein [Streptomyces sp. ICC1]
MLTRPRPDGGREVAGGALGQVVHLLARAGWSWAAFAFAVGWVCRSWRRAVWLAPAALTVAVTAYYLVKMAQGEFRAFDMTVGYYEQPDPLPIDWAGFLSKAVAWWVAAVTFGPLLGWAGTLARRPHLSGLAFRLLVPLIAIVDMTVRLPGSRELDGAVAIDTWSTVRIAAAVTCALLTVWALHTTLRARRVVRT